MRRQLRGAAFAEELRGPRRGKSHQSALTGAIRNISCDTWHPRQHSLLGMRPHGAFPIGRAPSWRWRRIALNAARCSMRRHGGDLPAYEERAARGGGADPAFGPMSLGFSRTCAALAHGPVQFNVALMSARSVNYENLLLRPA